MKTRGSTKIDHDKSKEVKVTPTKEKGKKKVIKVKEEKTKDKTTPKNEKVIKVKEEKTKDKTTPKNEKVIEKENLLTSPSKVADEKDLELAALGLLALSEQERIQSTTESAEEMAILALLALSEYPITTTPESTETFLSNSPSYDQDMSPPISTSPHKDTPEAEENSNLPEETSHLHSMESEDFMSQSITVFLANRAASRETVFPSKAASLLKRPYENCDILSPRKKIPKLDSSEPFSSKLKSSSKCNKDNTVDSDKGMSIVDECLSELKKAYVTLKAEVAKIDRRLEKAKRKRESASRSSQYCEYSNSKGQC